MTMIILSKTPYPDLTKASTYAEIVYAKGGEFVHEFIPTDSKDFLREYIAEVYERKPERNITVIATNTWRNANSILLMPDKKSFIAQAAGSFSTQEKEKIAKVLEHTTLSNSATRNLLNVVLGKKCVFGYISKENKLEYEYHDEYHKGHNAIYSEPMPTKVDVVVKKDDKLTGKPKYTTPFKLDRSTTTHCEVCGVFLGDGKNFEGWFSYAEEEKRSYIACEACKDWFIVLNKE